RDARPPHRTSPRDRERQASSTAPAAPVATASPVRDPQGPDVPVDETARRIDWLRRMTLIREFETRCDQLVRAGRIPGGMHAWVGQEAVAVGVAGALRSGDLSAGTHRSHHHALAMGIPATALMAELFGKATGSNGGRGGSMHVADLSRGFIGGNGIVGAG